MPRDNKENILFSEVDNSINTFISCISYKVKVLIIGGGRAGFIKANTFAKNGAMVTVLSKDFCTDFNKFKNYSNVKIVLGEYDKKYLLKNHLIVIAIDNEIVCNVIKNHCDELCKLYLDCSNFKEGLFLVPCQRSTNTVNFGLSTKEGSPKTSRYIAEKIKHSISQYDSFIDFNCKLRNIIKELKEMSDIMEFVSSDDFYFFYKKNKYNYILKMFYPNIDFNL